MDTRSASTSLATDIPRKGAAPVRGWGSDYFAQLIRATGIKYIALNPGASFRGIHDSLVNFLGNEDPAMLLCLHEEHAVAIAQGYAKVCDEPMGVFLHSNVGLLHGAMALFNAWCDRSPMLVFGATGPADAAERRPWIDWIHTVRDQGSLVRDYVKWDDQPTSLAAAAESVMRASVLASTSPKAPTYVCFDVGLQEQEFDDFPPLPDPARFRPPAPARANAKALRAAAEALCAADRPVILAGRVSRSIDAWQQRIELAEWLGARVITDIKTAAAFPSHHPLHVGPPGAFLTPPQIDVLREADVLLDLNWIALAGALGAACPDASHGTLIQLSNDALIHRSNTLDHHGLAAVDIGIACAPDDVMEDLLVEVKRILGRPKQAEGRWRTHETALPDAPGLTNESFARTVQHALRDTPHTLARLNIGWPGSVWHVAHPMDYLGNDGGGGVGSGPGNAIGVALGLRGDARMVVAVLGDGDFMMGSSALWTACRYRIPLMVIIVNNQSFYNDELHQEKMALLRDRVVENKWIGQAIRDPDLDLVAIAKAQGAETLGPVGTPLALQDAIAKAASRVGEGAVCVIDARVSAGYDDSMKSGMLAQAGAGR